MKSGKRLIWIAAAALVVVALAVVVWRVWPAPGQSGGYDGECTLAIRCTTVLDHPDLLDREKAELIPADGVILAQTTAAFSQGESAFDLLKRVCREREIHLEFSTTPGTNAAYIEGIGNLYAMDCGERSGWLYQVNGQSPDRGCSDWTLQAGDRVEFLYSCDWGADLEG